MTDTDFTVISDLPIPPQVRPVKYPFGEMGVGDSFLSPSKAAVNAAHVYACKHPTMKFTTRAVEGGWRIWRI